MVRLGLSQSPNFFFRRLKPMLYGFDRRRVSEFLVFQANKIDTHFAFGRRQDNLSAEDNFVLAFFLNCSDDDLQYLNSFVQPKDEELLILFAKKRENGSTTALTAEEKANWDFSKPWKVSRPNPGWDELREVIQDMLVIVY